MTLSKLTIRHETTVKTVFNGSVQVLFNPNKLSYQRSISWETVDSATISTTGRRGRLNFHSIVPETLNIELFFDTYEPVSGLLAILPGGPKSVLDYTGEIEALGAVKKELHRPPACQLQWGKKILFEGVMAQMSKTLDLFNADGVPLRATMQCTFTDAKGTGELNSPDVAKTYIVQPRDNLLRIANVLYEDISLWRVIAQANGIDDPRRELTPGKILAIPAIQ